MTWKASLDEKNTLLYSTPIERQQHKEDDYFKSWTSKERENDETQDNKKEKTWEAKKGNKVCGVHFHELINSSESFDG